MPNRFRRRAGVLALVLVTAGCGPASVAPPATDAPPDGTPPVATALPRTPPSGPSEPNPATPFDPTAVTIALEEVVPLPGAPVAIAAPHDGSGRLFVAERGGQVWVVRDGRRSQQPFLDVAARVTAGGERGLLGLAVTPEFPDDPRFFIYYTNLDEDQVVEERRLDPGDADRADPGYEREILRMDDFAGNHNGGALAFGPDGFLYIATGDGGGAGDPQETGQRTDTYLGKILRIGVEPRDAPRDYQLPPDNPLAGQGGLPEIWHLGLRNPWRFSFDRATGDLWIGDVGQGQWEEIDVARGGAGGLNRGPSLLPRRRVLHGGTDPAGDRVLPRLRLLRDRRRRLPRQPLAGVRRGVPVRRLLQRPRVGDRLDRRRRCRTRRRRRERASDQLVRRGRGRRGVRDRPRRGAPAGRRPRAVTARTTVARLQRRC
jgi:glucose/arabinose dehydrogenase